MLSNSVLHRTCGVEKTMTNKFQEIYNEMGAFDML